MSVEHEKLKEILAEAAGLGTPEERAAYLDTACQGDAPLRARVEQLLQAHDLAGDFLEQSVLPPLDETIGEGPGDVIGRYKLLEEIGEGGFGRVVMAEQTEPVRRRVALKIIKAGMDTREVIARFEAERQALALMEHPNIAKVLDAGATDTGRPYFVMELVKGIPITDYCDRAKLPMEARLHLFMKLCHAVQHAHQKGVIHRDLKPSNILVTVIDGEPVPKIIDFGVAKALGQQLTERTLFTAFQQVIGTPAYMSPEQAELSGTDVDTRSDIYSLGVLLYELLTGVTPLDTATLRQAALDEIRRMIRETEPPKPSTRLRTMGVELNLVAQHRHTEPSALSRSVHGDLDWIVMKALEKDRGRRYETAGALEDDLRHHLDHEPVQAGPPGALYRMRKFIRRHRMGVALAASVTVLLIAGLLVSLLAFANASRERNRAVSAELLADQERDRAEQSARQESQQRQRAEANAEAARIEKELAAGNLQMAQISLIEHHLDKGQVGPALTLLEEQRSTVNLRDSRSIEWRHLWWRAHRGHRFTMRGHEGSVSALVCIPGGSLVASGDANGTVKLWDMDTGQERATLVRNQQPIWCMAVSPDGKTLAWGDGNGVLTVWDLLQGRRQATVFAHDGAVRGLAFSPDSRVIATCARDGTARVWLAGSGECAGPVLAFGGSARLHSIDAVAFSPDGRTLACAEGGSVALWDVSSWKVRARLQLRHLLQITALGFTPDCKTLVSGRRDNSVNLWDVDAAREKATFLPKVHRPNTIALSVDGTTVAIGGDCGTIEVRDLASGHTKTYGHVGRVFSLAFAPDGRTLASAGDDRTIKVWDLTQTQDLPPLHGNQTLNWSVAYSPDGKTLACAGDPDPELWDVASGRLLRTIPVGGSACAVFSPDGKVLAGRNWLWDLAAERRLPSVPEGGLAAAFSPDGKTLATGGFGNVINLWDWAAGQRRATLHQPGSWIWSLAWSPDGLALAAASSTNERDGEAVLWEVESGHRKQTLKHGFARVAFSPDGRILATGSKSGGITLWDPNTGQMLRDLVGHVLFMEDLAFAPDGKTIVACNVQGGVTLWDVERGIERATLTRPGHSVFSAAFAPDGRTFATGGRWGTLEIWRTACEVEVRAQSDCFDPRLRLACKHQDEAKACRVGRRPQDALLAYSRAEDLYRELAAEFPERGDYQYTRLGNLNNLVSLAAAGIVPLEDPERWLRMADDAVAQASRDPARLGGLLRPALRNRFALLQRVGRPAGAAADGTGSWKQDEEVLAVVRRILGPEHPETLKTMHALAVACWSNDETGSVRRLPEAEAVLRELLTLQKDTLGHGHPDVAHALIDLAAVLRDQGKLAEAEMELREFLGARQNPLGNAQYDGVLAMLGGINGEMGHFAEALDAYSQVLELSATNEQVRYLNALLCSAAGDTMAYRAAAAEIVAQMKKAKPGPNVGLLHWACVLAPDAVIDYSPVLQAVRRSLAQGSNRTDRLQDLQTLGALLYRSGRHSEAIRQLAAAYEVGQRTDPSASKGSPAYGAYFLVMAHAQIGETNEARKWFQRASELDPLVTPAGVDAAPGTPWNRQLTLQLLRKEAEPLLDPAAVAAARTPWMVIRVALQRGLEASTDQRWPEAAEAYATALQHPQFSWPEFRDASPAQCLGLQMGIAFVRAEDTANHERLCRLLMTVHGDQPTVFEAERFAKLCFLAGNSLPRDLRDRALELGRFAVSNRTLGGIPLWPCQSAGIAEYYAGDAQRAVELFTEAEGAKPIGCRGGAMVYHAMALKKLGRDEEAAELLQQADALLAEQLEGGSDEPWWDLELCRMALEEARRLIDQAPQP